MSIALHYSFRKIDHESFCDDDTIPEESVEQVYLKVCDLTAFPEWLFKLRNLTHVNISCNAIARVPIEFSHLQNLNYLDMSDNQIAELPPTFFELVQLKYLDLSGNFLDCIPSAIKNLANLELLNFDRNFLMEVPPEITECTKVFQLSFDECARLFTLPRNLFTMPKLVSASFKGCNLITVPAIVPSHLCHLNILGNQILNCVPHEIYLKFVPQSTKAADFYQVEADSLEELHDARTNFIKNSPEIGHMTLTNGNIANVPHDVVKIFHGSSSSGGVVSLREICMRRVRSSASERDIVSLHLPHHLRRLISHPLAVCACRTLIVSETHAAFFQFKLNRNPYLCIVKFACSASCLKRFCDENREKIVLLT